MTKFELNPEFRTKSNPEQIKEKFKMAAKITGTEVKAENGKTIKALKVTLANLETELREANANGDYDMKFYHRANEEDYEDKLPTIDSEVTFEGV